MSPMADAEVRPAGRSARPRRRRWAALVAVLALQVAVGGLLPAHAGAVVAAADATGGAELRYSHAPDYSGARPLGGADLTGRVAIHLGEGVVPVRGVTFSLDGEVVQVEDNPPWNLSGNTTTRTGMLDTSTLSSGPHTVDADVTTDAGTSRVSAVFTVGGTPPPAEPVEDDPELVYSLTDDYASPQPLDGAQLSGRVAVVVRGEGVTSVSFAVDGRYVRTERVAPFDLGGDTGRRSHLFDTSALPTGTHTVTAEVRSASGVVRTVAATFSSTAAPTPPAAGTRTLTVEGDGFLLDGVPFDMWGIRTASATYDQAQTDHLIAQLDTYRAHGVNTVAVYYMGSRGANYDPFTPDGTSVDRGHQARMEQIIRAADARGMVVVVGIFYQAAPLRLEDADAVRSAVRTVTTALRPYRNVVINIANEQSAGEYADTADVYDLRNPARIVDLLSIVHDVDPERVAGGGGYSRSNNVAIGRSPQTDVLLFDTGLGDTREQLPEYRAFRAAGITKPVVNVEQFGGYTNDFDRGVFPSELRAKYQREIDSAAAEPGLYTFFHNGPWLQVRPMRYDLGGAGTAASPGIAWYFQRVKDATDDGDGDRP